MKRTIETRGSAAWGSLYVFALSSACHVIVEKSDGTGGQPAVSESSARVAVSSGRAPNRGATFEFSFDVAQAGSYVFSLSEFTSVPVLMTGAKPGFLSEPYTFRID